MIGGRPKFDGLTLGEVRINLLRGNPHIETKAAFVSTATGHTHGWTEQQGPWSPAVLEKLRELCSLLERDLARVHLQSADGIDTPGVPFSEAPDVESSGLGEHVQNDSDVPSF